MSVTVQHNSETDKYDIMQDGVPMVNANGARVDGGGHDVQDKAVRQAGYIQAGLEKKAKREAEETDRALQE